MLVGAASAVSLSYDDPSVDVPAMSESTNPLPPAGERFLNVMQARRRAQPSCFLLLASPWQLSGA